MAIISMKYLTIFLITYIDLAYPSQTKFQIFRGFKISTILNAATTLLVSHHNIWIEPQCLDLCKEEICTAVVINMDAKQCDVNKYGRVILEPDASSTTWVKCTDVMCIYRNLYTYNLKLS